MKVSLISTAGLAEQTGLQRRTIAYKAWLAALGKLRGLADCKSAIQRSAAKPQPMIVLVVVLVLDRRGFDCENEDDSIRAACDGFDRYR